MALQPSAILFACSMNSVRSPMAEAIMKYLHGQRIFVDSVGVRPGEHDPFVDAVMEEIGIDVTKHRVKTFEQLDDDYFDLIITLSPEAHHKALEMTRTMACDVEYWPTNDATAVDGSRDMRLDAYRDVRDTLLRRLTERFSPGPAADV
ncbi:MAG: low molecular weight phosphatase family protein [Rhodospirillales bacterium]|jgi:protein-tyrosine-phosphatase|nr:low molecular weight phosphatase family protein [Rhodospirillales bacterium]